MDALPGDVASSPGSRASDELVLYYDNAIFASAALKDRNSLRGQAFVGPISIHGIVTILPERHVSTTRR